MFCMRTGRISDAPVKCADLNLSLVEFMNNRFINNRNIIHLFWNIEQCLRLESHLCMLRSLLRMMRQRCATFLQSEEEISRTWTRRLDATLIINIRTLFLNIIRFIFFLLFKIVNGVFCLSICFSSPRLYLNYQ